MVIGQLVSVLTLLFYFSTSALAQTYPPCPKTKKLPRKATHPFTRCLDANQYTCCDDCKDISLMVYAVSVNSSVLLEKLGPTASSLLGLNPGTESQLCSGYDGSDKCGPLLEQVSCALFCNPDAGTYLSTTGEGAALRGTARVCNTYSQHVYNTCTNYTIHGLPLSSLIPTPSRFLNTLFGHLAGVLGAGSYTIDVVPDGQACYAGPKQYPVVPICCDPFNIPDYCPANTANFTKYPSEAKVVGRTVDPVACAAYLSAPTPAPAPAASSPAAAVNGTPSALNSSSPTPSSTPSPPKSAASIVQGLGIFFWASVFVAFNI